MRTLKSIRNIIHTNRINSSIEWIRAVYSKVFPIIYFICIRVNVLLDVWSQKRDEYYRLTIVEF